MLSISIFSLMLFMDSAMYTWVMHGDDIELIEVFEFFMLTILILVFSGVLFQVPGASQVYMFGMIAFISIHLFKLDISTAICRISKYALSSFILDISLIAIAEVILKTNYSSFDEITVLGLAIITKLFQIVVTKRWIFKCQ